MPFLYKPAWLIFAFAVTVPALGQPAHDGHAQETAAGTSGPGLYETALRPAPSFSMDFESAFQSYRSYADEPLMPWSQANDQVGRIGGWRAYAREAQEPAAPDASATTTPTAPAAAPAGDHGAHKQP